MAQVLQIKHKPNFKLFYEFFKKNVLFPSSNTEIDQNTHTYTYTPHKPRLTIVLSRGNKVDGSIILKHHHSSLSTLCPAKNKKTPQARICAQGTMDTKEPDPTMMSSVPIKLYYFYTE